jgi:hypothetical protein
MTHKIWSAHYRFNNLLQRITYKPEWSFRVNIHEEEMLNPLYLSIQMNVEDTYNKGTRIDVESKHDLPSRMILGWAPSEDNDAEFFIWVREQIHWREQHEADEWLRIDGVMVWNPHLPHVKITDGQGVLSENTSGSYPHRVAQRIREMMP